MRTSGLTSERCVGKFDEKIVDVGDGPGKEALGVFTVDRWIEGDLSLHCHVVVGKVGDLDVERRHYCAFAKRFLHVGPCSDDPEAPRFDVIYDDPGGNGRERGYNPMLPFIGVSLEPREYLLFRLDVVASHERLVRLDSCPILRPDCADHDERALFEPFVGFVEDREGGLRARLVAMKTAELEREIVERGVEIVHDVAEDDPKFGRHFDIEDGDELQDLPFDIDLWFEDVGLGRIRLNLRLPDHGLQGLQMRVCTVDAFEAARQWVGHGRTLVSHG